MVVDASGQNGLLMNRLRLRVWDPMLNKGAIWTYWEGAYRDTGRDEGATLVIQTGNKNGWFWYIPLHDDIVSVGVVAPFDYLFKGRGTLRADLRGRGRGLSRRQGARRERAKRITGYFATKDYSYRSTQVAGDGWVLVGDAFGFLDPLLLLRRPAGAASLASWPPMRSSKGSRRATRRRRSWASGARCSTRASTACGAWSASTTTASASATWCAAIRDLRGTMTDLLIGDLFTDRVDKVWQPLESLYAPGKTPIPTWDAGTPAHFDGQAQRADASRRAASHRTPCFKLRAASLQRRSTRPYQKHRLDQETDHGHEPTASILTPSLAVHAEPNKRYGT